MGFWQEYRTVSRFEFLPATSVAILIGVFLAADGLAQLATQQVLVTTLVGLVVFVLLFNVGFQCNCWADWEVDETYKTHLARSVRAIGRTRLLKLWVGHTILALALTAALALWYSRFDLLVLVMVGTFFGVFYSVPPLRFKSRGALHGLMAFPVFTVPGLFAYLLVRPLEVQSVLGLAFLLVVIGITAAHYGLVLISQAEDLPDDRAAKIRTPPVAFGLDRTVRAALLLNATGNGLALLGLALLMASVHWVLLLVAIAVLLAAYSVPLRMLLGLQRRVAANDDEAALLAHIRTVMVDYPKFHGAPLFATMLLGLVRVALLSRGVVAPLPILGF